MYKISILFNDTDNYQVKKKVTDMLKKYLDLDGGLEHYLLVENFAYGLLANYTKAERFNKINDYYLLNDEQAWFFELMTISLKAREKYEFPIFHLPFKCKISEVSHWSTVGVENKLITIAPTELNKWCSNEAYLVRDSDQYLEILDKKTIDIFYYERKGMFNHLPY